MKSKFTIKRIYDEPSGKDGYRVLVDRLWPRGVKKEGAKLDEWAKELAPTPTLRTWFGHDPERWKEFQKKYKAELKQNENIAPFIEQHKDKKLLTLLYGTKDEQHTHAIVLKEFLEKKMLEES